MSNLPKGWSLVELNEICNINMGQSPKSESYNENNIGLPLIQGNADIKNRKTLPRTYTSDITKKCKIGDIIMTVRAPVGAIAKSYHNACIGRGVCSITPKENNDFLYHFLVGYEDKWDKLSQGSTFTAVNGNDIKKIKLPLPPLEEQKKIADILSTVDKKIAFVEENINATEELKKALMQKLLTEGIGHTEFKDSELGRIPQSWEVVKFKEITKVRQGLQIPISKRKKEKCENCYEYITIQFIKNNKEVEYIENPQKTVICTENDILMTRTGNTGIVVTNVKGVFHNNFFLIDFDRNEISKEYLVYYLNSNSIQKEILLRAGATTIPDLNHGDFYSIKFISPPLEEQKQIAEILSTVDNKLENLKEKKQSFEELKKGLMQKLLTGEVRV